MSNLEQLNTLFILVSAAVIVFTVLSFFVFLYWSKRDRQRRNAALRYYNQKFHPKPGDPKDD